MMGLVCEHGSLGRQCDRCESAARIAALEAECERLRGDLEVAESRKSGAFHDLKTRARTAEAALAAAREAAAIVSESLRHCDVILADKAWFWNHPTPVEALDHLHSRLAALRSRADDSGRVERVANVLKSHGWSDGETFEDFARAVLDAADGRDENA